MLYKDFSGILFNREKKIIIDWSSKSACTIIVKMFFAMNNQTIDPNVWIHDERERYVREKGHIRLSNLLDPRPLKIKFVRNPYSRAVSSYIHYSKYLSNKLDEKYHDISFIEFCQNLKNNNIPPNIHWTYQKLYVERFFKFFNEIIKIEYLSDEIERINRVYSLNFNCDFTSDHFVNKNNDTEFVGNLKYSQIADKIPKYRYFYNKEIQSLVRNIYLDDIQSYDYSFDEFLKFN